MMSGQVAKIAWLGIRPSSTKESTVTQISATRSTPRKIWRPSARLRATRAMPPDREAERATTKAAKNQKRIMTTVMTL